MLLPIRQNLYVKANGLASFAIGIYLRTQHLAIRIQSGMRLSVGSKVVTGTLLIIQG